MNVEKLGKSVRKELTRNPKKSAILGLMCLVALYFWAPLLLRWLPGKGEKPSSSEATEVAAGTVPGVTLSPAVTASPTAGATATPVVAVPTSNWRELVEWMEREEYMRPATAIATRDPFSDATTDGVLQSGSSNVQGGWTATGEVSPEQMNLVLGSTIVGGNVRLAVINGRAYREQAIVRVAADEEQPSDGAATTGIEYTVVEIHPQHVVLERLGHQYPLRLKQPTADGDLQIVRREQ